MLHYITYYLVPTLDLILATLLLGLSLSCVLVAAS
jgi:hypothetical protein